MQLLTMPIDSPAAYRLRPGAALDEWTDRFELYRLLVTGDDLKYNFPGSS